MTTSKKICFFNNVIAPLVEKTSELTEHSAPFNIGIVGPSASGKSTLAVFLKNYLVKIHPELTISIVPLDNFIFSNKYLIEHNLMDRKGFPESFNAQALKDFINQIQKNDQVEYQIPFYSHAIKDIHPTETFNVLHSQIYIFEGINLFYPYELDQPFCLSDIINWSIYLDINLAVIKERSINRLLAAYDEARKSKNPAKFFKPLLTQSFDEVYKFAENLWEEIDVPTINKYIKPQQKLATEVVKELPTLEEFSEKN